MITKRIFFDSKPLEFGCEIRDVDGGKQVHLNYEQTLELYSKIASVIKKPQPESKAQQEKVVSHKLSEISATQRNKMIAIKKELKIKNNDELNPFVIDWSLRKMSTWRELTPQNINNFMEYIIREEALEI